MKTETQDLIQIKKTKSVWMAGNNQGLWILIDGKRIDIPKQVVFQVVRGLTSYTQRFYRRNK